MAAFQILSSTINLFISIIFILLGITFWARHEELNYGATEGIYCIFFATFLIASEFGSTQKLYSKHFAYFQNPLGRGIEWYGIMSFIVVLIITAATFLVAFVWPAYTYVPLFLTRKTPNTTDNASVHHDNLESTYPQSITLPEYSKA